MPAAERNAMELGPNKSSQAAATDSLTLRLQEGPACLEGCLRFSAAAEMAIKDEEPAGMEVKLEDSWNWLGIFVT